MFGTIRRHQSWLWIIIAGITIISFVVYFGPNNNKLLDSLGKGGRYNLGTVAGQPITERQYANARHEVYLDYFLQNRQWPDRASSVKSGFIEAREIYMRLFMIDKQRELGIEISQKAVADRARHMLGDGSPDQFVDQILKPEGLDYDDFERTVRHDLGMEQLYMTVAMSGTLVTPQEAETLYRNEHQDVVSSAVFFSATNFFTDVIVTPAQVSQFYTNELANYRIPKRVEASYVKYNITNYLATARKELTNLDQVIDQSQELLRYATNAASRARLKEDLVRNHALRDAEKDANAFAIALDNMPGTNRIANMAALAEKHGLKIQHLAPFDSKKGPAGIDVSSEFVRAAFQLTPDEPFSPPIPAEDGVYVLALERMLPSEIPPLANIESEVTKDYRTAKAMQLAQEASIKFSGMLTNGLAHGRTFAAICAEARVKPEAVPPFSLSTQTAPEGLEQRLSLRMLKDAVFGTPPGHASPPIPSRDGGCVLYVEKRLPIDEAKMKKDFPKFLAEVRQGRESDAFNQWFQRQVNRDPAFAAVVQKVVEDAEKQGGSRQPSS